MYIEQQVKCKAGEMEAEYAITSLLELFWSRDQEEGLTKPQNSLYKKHIKEAFVKTSLITMKKESGCGQSGCWGPKKITKCLTSHWRVWEELLEVDDCGKNQ